MMDGKVTWGEEPYVKHTVDVYCDGDHKYTILFSTQEELLAWAKLYEVKLR